MRPRKSLVVAAWLALAAALGAARAEELNPAERSAIDRCRLAFPDAAANPSAAGGWLTDRIASVRVLCLYGSVVVAPEAFHDALDVPFDLVAVRSAGGPVASWLAAAEQLAGNVDIVLVDEACFSSCANYIIPLGRAVVALPDSLVVWHGGPTFAGLGEVGSGLVTMDELMNYYDLADRTERLYVRLGVDPKILRDSDHGEPGVLLSGYAFSPATLARCFGFSNVAAMWHAGDDEHVAALGHKRSATLNLAEAPKAGCDP